MHICLLVYHLLYAGVYCCISVYLFIYTGYGKIITITFYKHTLSLLKTDWTSRTHYFALPCLLYGRLNSLINVFEAECLWLRLLENYMNVNIVFSCILFTFILVVFVVAFLFTCLPFALCWCLLLYFCLFFYLYWLRKNNYRPLEPRSCGNLQQRGGRWACRRRISSTPPIRPEHITEWVSW